MQHDDNIFTLCPSPPQPPTISAPQSKPNSRSSSVFEDYDMSAEAKRRRLIESLNSTQMSVSSCFENPSNGSYEFNGVQGQHSNVASSFDYSVSTPPSMPRFEFMSAMSQDQKLPTPSLTTLTLKDDSGQTAINMNDEFAQPNIQQTRATEDEPMRPTIPTNDEIAQPEIHDLTQTNNIANNNTEPYQEKLRTNDEYLLHRQTMDYSYAAELQAQQKQQLIQNGMVMPENKTIFPEYQRLQQLKQQQQQFKFQFSPNPHYQQQHYNNNNNNQSSDSYQQQQYLLAVRQHQQQQRLYQQQQQQQQQLQLRHPHSYHHFAPPKQESMAIDRPASSEQGVKSESEREVIVIEDDEVRRNACIGMVQTDIVTIKPIELVRDDQLERVRVDCEGRRSKTENYSFTVTASTLPRRFFGWVPFEETKILGPLVDARLIWWDAYIPRGRVNQARAPLYMILYCHDPNVAIIERYFKNNRFYLRDPPFWHPETQYNNINPYMQNPGALKPDGGGGYMNQYFSKYEMENGSKMKNDIQKLLDSIPSTVPKKSKKKKQHKETEDGRIILDSDDDEESEEEEEEEEDVYIEGLKMDLMPHQNQGVKWMVDRENNQSSGGILADMGLGKTIQTIALIASTMTSDEKTAKEEEGEEPKLSESADDHKVTLIVTPLSLIHQWEDEIRTKTDHGKMKVMIHHGGNRARDASVFANYDVVITTYQVVSSDLPNTDKKKRSVNNESGSGADTPVSDGTAASSAVASPIPSFTDNETTQTRIQVPSLSKSPKPVNNGTPGPILQFKWHRVVLDEAQQIKNRNTRASLSCSAITAAKRWCLTGTPIQNNIEDLYSLMRFLKIDPLSNYSKFKELIVSPIQAGRANVAMKRLTAVLSAIMLRRTKDVLKHANDDEVMEKPEEEAVDNTETKVELTETLKTEDIYSVDTPSSSASPAPIDGDEKAPLSKKIALKLPSRQKTDELLSFSPHERALYNLLTRKGQENIRNAICGAKKQSNYMNMLCILLRLRQACDHPRLILDNMDKDKDLLDAIPGTNDPNTGIYSCQLCGRQRLQQKASFCDTCRSQIDMAVGIPTDDEAFKSSTKIQKLLDILRETRERNPGEKTIVFSQFTSMLDLVEKPLRADGIKFCRYDGTMSSQIRERSLNSLRYDPDCAVMLISLKSGSLGLNLTAANRVILMDIWWNPAVEEQAIDRVHRIGQRLPVHVTRLMIDDTIEQNISKLQEKKARLIQGAMGNGVINNNSKLTAQEIHQLFDM